MRHILLDFIKYTFIQNSIIVSTISTSRKCHEKSHPNALSLRRALEYVSGSAYNIVCIQSGIDDTEKNVPHRNVIGRITNVLKVVML